MKKTILCLSIVLIFNVYLLGYASENEKEDLKVNNGAVETPPVVLRAAKPYYPAAAKADNIEGIVILKFVVTKDAEIKDIEIVESLPKGYFGDTAINTLKKYKFKPATRDGVPVDRSMQLPMAFLFYESSHFQDIETRIKAYRLANSGKNFIDNAKYQEAIEEVSEAIKLLPKYVTAYYYRSIAFTQIEEYEKALSDIDKAIELAGKVYGYYNQRGLINLFLKDYQKAIENFNKSIDIEPKNLMAYIHRGDSYRQSERYQEAIKDYSSALAIDGSLIHVNNNRGFLYAKLKDNTNACIDFKKACDFGDCRAFEHMKNKGVCSDEYPGSVDNQ